MNCFNHSTIPAIGSCKACNKGLCSDCAIDQGHGLACKDQHEQRVADLEMMISRNIDAFEDASKNIYIVPIFYIFMGVLFAGYSLYYDRGFADISLLLGIGFILLGIVLIVRNRKLTIAIVNSIAD